MKEQIESEQTEWRLNNPMNKYYQANPFLKFADEISHYWNKKHKHKSKTKQHVKSIKSS